MIGLDWGTESEAVQQALWDGWPFRRLPCIVSTPTPSDWPTYPSSGRWDDAEKQFIHGLLEIGRRIAGKPKILVWSGSLEPLREAGAINGNTRTLALPENRYGAKDLDNARQRLERVLKFQPSAKAARSGNRSREKEKTLWIGR